MSVEDQKRVVRRFFEEVWNQRHSSVAAEIISPDCITHQLRSGSPDTSAPRSPEIVSAHVAEWLAAFPDIHFSVDEVVAESDLVAVRCTATGTHTGSWLGILPTGRQITIRMAVTYRLAAGMIAEDWVLVDFLGVLQQLGLVQPTSELLQRSRQTEAGPSERLGR